MGNCRNLTLDDVKSFRIGRPSGEILRNAGLIFDRLMADFQKKSVISGRGDTEFQEFNWAASKDIVDEIDALLSAHYGFSDEEEDFIKAFDIKIRLGKTLTNGEGE